jgi:transposase, IS30 family
MTRIEIADGLARGEPVKQIAARIGKSYRSVYREIARNRKPDGRYQPWFVHNRAYERRRRCRPRRFAADTELRELVASKLGTHTRWLQSCAGWSGHRGQISRWLRRRHRRRPDWHVCSETIYQAVYRGLIVSVSTQNLRTGRTYRHRRGRGRDGAFKQSTPDAVDPSAAGREPLSHERRRIAGNSRALSVVLRADFCMFVKQINDSRASLDTAAAIGAVDA